MRRVLVRGGFVLATLLLAGPMAPAAPPREETQSIIPIQAPAFDHARPTIVLVRGWLWDPSSRRLTAPLEQFPERVNEILQREHGLTADFVKYQWTRVPKDVFRASVEFTNFARGFSESARSSGRCLGFVGHSAGAAMVYRSAANGVRMGYMGTLGLPTFGSGKPKSVVLWGNFYTDAHLDDVAGWAWARQMGADLNVNLGRSHREFWAAPEVARVTADAVARTWDRCA